MKLHQAKQKIAEKYGYRSFVEAIYERTAPNCRGTVSELVNELAESYAESSSKDLQTKINKCIASINGALDSFELDNTSDVIEKSIVIGNLKEQLNLLK